MNSALDVSLTTNPEPTWGFENLLTDSSNRTSSQAMPQVPPSSPFGQDTLPVLPTSPPNPNTVPQVQNHGSVTSNTRLIYVAISTDASGRQTTRKIQDPTTILKGDVRILRIYLPHDQLLPQCLHDMYTHFQQQGSNPLAKIHLCVRSLLRPCLQDINDDVSLKAAMTDTVSDWNALNASVKFYFLRKGVPADRDRFQNFVEKDLMRAVEGLRDGDVELSEILGDESCVFGQNAGVDGVPVASSVSTSEMVEEML